MKQSVYIETTVISYLTARPSPNVVVVGHQWITEQWWRTCRSRFDLVASQVVVQEASVGDPNAARQRLNALTGTRMLATTEEASTLAKELVASGAVPEKAQEDALHIAIAVTNSVDYLLTWNCKHLANAATRNRIDRVCEQAGYQPVIICTPEELLENS